MNRVKEYLISKTYVENTIKYEYRKIVDNITIIIKEDNFVFSATIIDNVLSDVSITIHNILADDIKNKLNTIEAKLIKLWTKIINTN